MQREVLKIGITAGDPAGIGPEVALKAVNALNDNEIIPIIIGRRAAFQKNYPGLFKDYAAANHSPSVQPGKKYLYDVDISLPAPVPGAGSPETGRESLACVDAALELWRSGSIDAVVTGPVSKGHIEKSGVPFTGHTEYIAAKTGGDPFMMMFSEKYRVILVTTHVPVSDIIRSINHERLLKVIGAGYESIRLIDGEEMKLAIAGLDPHCGDDGAIGTFDRDVTRIAVAAARGKGIPIEGPFAADTLFIPETWERYNLLIAHYHDQGLVPFKMLAFDSGVNVTLGLPIVRTSVDHGTAYDIAGKNIARWRSMTEAIRLAKLLVKKRKA